MDSFDKERQAWQELERGLRARVKQLVEAKQSQSEAMSLEPVLPSHGPVLRSSSPVSYPASTSTTTAPATAAEPDPNLVASLAALRSERDQLVQSYQALTVQHDKQQEDLQQLREANSNLQDENESFQLLLGERTLSGEILGQGVFRETWNALPPDATSSTRSKRRSRLMEEVLEEEEDEVYEDRGAGSMHAGAVAADGVVKRKASRSKMRGAPTAGLDLAAELDRAEDHDFNEEAEEDRMRSRRTHNGRESSTISITDWPEERAGFLSCSFRVHIGTEA